MEKMRQMKEQKEKQQEEKDEKKTESMKSIKKKNERIAKKFTQSIKDDEFGDEKEEDKESDRQSIFWRKRLKENRILMADHLKEMADMLKERSEEKIKIIKFQQEK